MLDNVDANAAATEDGPAVALDSAPLIDVTDVDGTMLTSATVAITGGFVLGDVLAADEGLTGISVTYDGLNGLLTLSGADTHADYEQVLQSVTFASTNDAPGAMRTVTWTIIDDGSPFMAGTPQTTNIIVTLVNDAPDVSPATLAAVNEDTANPPGATVATLFAGALFSDPDDPAETITGVAISGNTANAATEGAWQYSTDAGASWFDVGTVAEDTALALSASSLIRFVPVSNFNGTPAGLTVYGLDNTYAGGFTSGVATVTVDATTNGGITAISDKSTTISTSITAVNDAPAGTPASGTLAYTENQAATALDTDIAITDVDDTDLEGAVVQLAGFVAGQDVLGFIDQNGIAGNFDAGTGILTLTGSATLAEYEAALESVTYFNSSDDPSVALRAALFAISDDGVSFTAFGTVAVNVTPVNDPPVLGSVTANRRIRKAIRPPRWRRA